jgi:signal transduction histidine kinase
VNALLSVTLEQTKQVAVDSDEVRRRFDELRRQILNMSAAVHTLSHELHSSTLRYLDVSNAMRGLCTELSKKQKVEINFSDKDIPGTVPKEISLCLFRVLQEALHNALKHSGVRHFDIELRGTLSALHLTVRDSGFGFDLEAMKGRGLGLDSMHERLKLVDGELTIDSQPGRGTTIHARVPLALGKASAQPAR